MWPRAPHPLPKPRPLSTDTALWSRVAAMAGRQGALASADSAHGIIECDHHATPRRSAEAEGAPYGAGGPRPPPPPPPHPSSPPAEGCRGVAPPAP